MAMGKLIAATTGPQRPLRFNKRMTRKRFAKRSGRIVRARRLLSFTTAPVPLRMATKFKYVSEFTLNPGAAGTAGVHVFSANGLYDPDLTGIGHQPRGFDQLMSMYDHYTVLGSKITVSFMHSTGVLYNNMSVGITLKDASSVETDKNEYQEARVTNFLVLPGSTTTDQALVRTLSMKSSTKNFLGIQHPMSSAVCRGTIAANPTEQCYFHCWAAPYGATDEQVLQCSVQIEYLAVLTEPQQPTQS